MDKYTEMAERLDKPPRLGLAPDVPTLTEAAALLRKAAGLEAALREIGSYELNYVRQESPLEALLALQRYARAALDRRYEP